MAHGQRAGEVTGAGQHAVWQRVRYRRNRVHNSRSERAHRGREHERRINSAGKSDGNFAAAIKPRQQLRRIIARLGFSGLAMLHESL